MHCRDIDIIPVRAKRTSYAKRRVSALVRIRVVALGWWWGVAEGAAEVETNYGSCVPTVFEIDCRM